MRLFKDKKAEIGVDFEDKAPSLSMSLQELLSRKVVDTTINKIIFRPKKNCGERWTSFIKNIIDNNDLERLHKTDTKMKSMYGKTYIGFDIWNGNIHIWIADNVANNQALRLNGLDQYAVMVQRTYSTINGGQPILRNQLVITQKNIGYLFLGGFGLNNNKIEIDKVNNNELEKEKVLKSWIPLSWAQIMTPAYIIDNFKVGVHDHDYGVLPCVEMLNKDYVDNDSGGVEISNPGSDNFFSDWFVAKDLFDLYNGFLRYFGGELCLDHTRIIGTFSQQDMNELSNDQRKRGPIRSLVDYLANKDENSKTANWLKKKLILSSRGGEGSQLEKMQSTLRGIEHVQTLEDLTSYAFKVCGYSWEGQTGQVYENVSQTMNSSKGVYETTKEKITLFERQWIDFYSRCAFAFFKRAGVPFANLNECKEDFVKHVDFQIVSNVLQQENNDWRKVIELKQNDLISTEKAIRDINPELTQEEVQHELELIEESKEDNKQDYWDRNMDFNGSEENENNAIDNNGETDNE